MRCKSMSIESKERDVNGDCWLSRPLYDYVPSSLSHFGLEVCLRANPT